MAQLAKVVLMSRACDRRRGQINDTIRVENKPFDIVIGDLSVNGFEATTDVDLQPGDRVVISSSPIQTREAEVAWANDGKVRFRFISPPRELDVASAEPVDTVVPLSAGEFPVPAPSAGRSIEKTVKKWPRPLRALFVLGSAILLWAIIIALIRLL